jgi:RimJ/RimL family protein N-acetyltransferase
MTPNDERPDDSPAGTPPLIATDRLVVRRFRASDAAALHAYRNDPDVARWQGWTLPYSQHDADQLATTMATIDMFTLGEWTQLGIALPSAPDTLVGDVGVRMEAEEPTAEIGFTLARASWGLGYASEAVTAVVEYLLHRLALARVVAFTHEENVKAQHVLERAGLRFITQDGDEFVYYRRAE